MIPAHVRESRIGVGEEHSVASIATRPFRPCVYASRLCPRAPRGGNGPQFPRLWRQQTAPPRHRASSGCSRAKGRSRNTAKRQGNHGTLGGIRRFAPLTGRIRKHRVRYGTPGGIREPASLAMKAQRSWAITPDPQVRRRIRTRGTASTYALATGVRRHRAADRGTEDGSQRPRRHPGGTELR